MLISINNVAVRRACSELNLLLLIVPGTEKSPEKEERIETASMKDPVSAPMTGHETAILEKISPTIENVNEPETETGSVTGAVIVIVIVTVDVREIRRETAAVNLVITTGTVSTVIMIAIGIGDVIARGTMSE